jgi:hypothetical protein
MINLFRILHFKKKTTAYVSDSNKFLYMGFRGGPGNSVGIATGWAFRGSKPSKGEIFHTRPDRPWGPFSLLYNGYWVCLGSKVAGAWC